MPFVPFQKKSATGAAPQPTAPPVSKHQFGRSRKTGKVAPAQKGLMNPGGRSMGGGGR